MASRAEFPEPAADLRVIEAAVRRHLMRCAWAVLAQNLENGCVLTGCEVFDAGRRLV